MNRIAVVGSGISGLLAAHRLSHEHEVHLFEADARLGGHTHTLDVDTASGRYAVDTGFIVFNDWTYPRFIHLMNELGVSWQDSSMSFSVKSERSGIEYNGTSLRTLFAQKRNLFRPSFHRMILEILRFNRESLELLEGDDHEITLGSYLKSKAYSRSFIDHYIIPMGAAIWSSSVGQMEEFPARFFIRFFKNHGMLSVDERPVWKVLQGGSRSYIAPITQRYRDRIHLGTPVIKVTRESSGVNLDLGGEYPRRERFDQVVLACHSDQALAMLSDPTEREREILGAFAYQPNETVLHTDTSILPQRPRAWAAWNYLVPQEDREKVPVTYHMNILQRIHSPENFLVSLNLGDRIDPSQVIRRMTYDHPVFTRKTVEMQKRWEEINGFERGTFFAGAYWSYGFHEDGVRSAERVIEQFNRKTKGVA